MTSLLGRRVLIRLWRRVVFGSTPPAADWPAPEETAGATVKRGKAQRGKMKGGPAQTCCRPLVTWPGDTTALRRVVRRARTTATSSRDHAARSALGGWTDCTQLKPEQRSPPAYQRASPPHRASEHCRRATASGERHQRPNALVAPSFVDRQGGEPTLQSTSPSTPSADLNQDARRRDCTSTCTPCSAGSAYTLTALTVQCSRALT